MPLYEYACRACGNRSEKMRKVSQRLEGPECPECGAATALALSMPAKIGAGGPDFSAASDAASCGPGCCGGTCTPSLN